MYKEIEDLTVITYVKLSPISIKPLIGNFCRVEDIDDNNISLKSIIIISQTLDYLKDKSESKMVLNRVL